MKSLFFVLTYCILNVLSADDICYKCASSILKSNWGVTGFSNLPQDIVFTDDCLNVTKVDTFCTRQGDGCVELITHIGGTVAAVRGCVNEFYSSDDLTNIPGGDESCGYVKASGDNGNGYDIVRYCRKEADEKCNDQITVDTEPVSGKQCTNVGQKKCVYCSWFDHHGSCKHNNDGECNGAYCVKSVGKFGDLKLEMRGCSLNPLGATYTYLDVPNYIALPGNVLNQSMHSMTGEKCRVCGEGNAQKHYSSICCSGCKGFFRRTVRYQRTYTCQNDDNCTIRAAYRNCCRACRFRRCIEAGLDPLMVHGDRGSMNSGSHTSPDSASVVSSSQIKTEITENSSPDTDEDTKALVKSDRSYLLEEEYKKWHQLALNMSFQMCDLNNKPLSAQRIIPDFNACDSRSVSKFFVLVERLCDDYFDSTASHMFSPELEHSFTTELPPEKAFFQPRSISTRTKIDWSPRYVLNSTGMKRMWCRIVAHYCDWVSHIPEFSRLSHGDKLRLIIDRTVPCIDILLAHRGLMTGAKGVVFSGGSYFPRDEKEQNTLVDPDIRPYLKRLTNWLFDEFIVPAKKMKLTEAEYAILRVLVFFVPVDGMSEEGKKIVREASNFYRNILCNEIKSEFPNWKLDQILDRVSHVMSFLQVIETAKVIEDEGFSVMTLFNIADMKGELTYEVHIRKGFSSKNPESQ
ncbi:hypothetical protein FO519_004775 [Halicephalobus sp. NKZ332]|nr:hypothetical protein FO519_004775 [Halicephalobus sp. NKZ332]